MEAVQLDYHVTPFRAERFYELYRADRAPRARLRREGLLFYRSEEDSDHFVHVSFWEDRADFEPLLVLARDAGDPTQAAGACCAAAPAALDDRRSRLADCTSKTGRPHPSPSADVVPTRAAGLCARRQPCSSGAIVRPASLELLPVELGRLALAGPHDRLAGVVDLVGDPVALVD